MAIKKSKLVEVTSSYASYGIVVRDGIVVDAPPIAKWLIGKSSVFARIWIRDKDGTAKLIDKDSND